MHKLNVLVVDDEEEIREILSFFITSNLSCNIQFATNGNEAISLISGEAFDLIVCDYNMPQKNGGEVYKHLLQTNYPARFVICSSDSPSVHEEFNDDRLLFGFIQKPSLIPGLNGILDKIKQEDIFVTAPDENSYIPISTNLLLSLSVMPSDVFIGLSDNKFLKVYDLGAIFDETDYLKYKQKFIDKLFVFNISTSVVIEKINSALIKISSIARSGNNLDAGLQIHSMLISTLKDFGFQAALVPAIESHIKDTIDFCKSDKAFMMLLNNLLKKKDTYLGQHSFLMAAVTVTLADKLEWISAPTSQKLVISSLFHDIFLKDTIHNELVTMGKKISDEEFLTHGQKAAELLDKMPRIPADTTRIILEHHEQGEDIGFPRGIEVSKTAPLSQLFTFSHYFVDTLIEMQAHGFIVDTEIYRRMELVSKKSPKYEKLFVALKAIKFF